MINKLRAALRISYFAIGSFYFISRYLIKAAIVGDDLDRALRMRRQWFRLINWGLGVKLEVFGEVPAEPGLLVCNHRSYYDPIVLLSQVFALPVGKAEVEHWPIIGYGAKISGVIFLERRTPEGRQKGRQDILRTLQSGYSVINYPEGTTHIRPQTNDFKHGMFKDAAKEGFTIFPVVHEYQTDTDAWIGEDTFMRHFFECFGKKSTHIRISYGPKITGDNTEELMHTTKQWIDEELLRLRKNWHYSDATMIKNERTKMV